MDQFLKKLTEGAENASALASSITQSGLKSVNEAFRGVKLFSSLSSSADEYVEYDETHYLLIPLIGSERQYAIYTKHLLPPDTGTVNSLPKQRIFHLPDANGKELLEQELLNKLLTERGDSETGSSDLADSLEKIADQIDSESEKITGGLLLIGGAVAIVNPIMGVGIAAKALLPSISTKATKAGAEFIGNKLRSWNKSSAISKLKKDASQEIKKLKPKIYTNQIIRSLEAIVSNPNTEFDPFTDQRTWPDQFQPSHYYSMTQEAIKEIYSDSWDKLDLTNVQPSHLEWVKSFISDKVE